jgi:Tlde1 domain
MTDRTGALYNLPALDAGYLTRETSPYTLSGATALALSVLVGGVLLSGRPIATLFATVPMTAPSADQMPESAPIATLASVRATPVVAPPVSVSYGALPDPRSLLRSVPNSFAQSTPLGSKFASIWPVLRTALIEPEGTPSISIPPAAELAVAPAPRPPATRLATSRSSVHTPPRQIPQETATAAVSPPPDNRSFLEKLFGMPQPSGPVLAYAAAEEGSIGNERRNVVSSAPVYDRWTAVYDIAAHTVYMPDGTRLEAHSGLGSMLDDPRYVSERMRGATPPGVYDLQLREQLFHGVEAVRLIPGGNAETLGRTGFLAHPYMLGPNGDSFGCVSFKNYNAFLQAYENGEVKHLVVVARLN